MKKRGVSSRGKQKGVLSVYAFINLKCANQKSFPLLQVYFGLDILCFPEMSDQSQDSLIFDIANKEIIINLHSVLEI